MSFNSKDYKGFTFRSGPVKKTTKQNQQNLFDPELQSLFLELESLQASP